MLALTVRVLVALVGVYAVAGAYLQAYPDEAARLLRWLYHKLDELDEDREHERDT